MTLPGLMFDMFGNPLKKFVSSMLENLSERYKLNTIGKISDVNFDVAKKEIRVQLELFGEENPIEISFGYRKAPPHAIELFCVSASRKWMEALINEVIPAEKKQFEVPAIVFPLL
jgi:hypothetical protein